MKAKTPGQAKMEEELKRQQNLTTKRCKRRATIFRKLDSYHHECDASIFCIIQHANLRRPWVYHSHPDENFPETTWHDVREYGHPRPVMREPAPPDNANVKEPQTSEPKSGHGAPRQGNKDELWEDTDSNATEHEEKDAGVEYATGATRPRADHETPAHTLPGGPGTPAQAGWEQYDNSLAHTSRDALPMEQQSLSQLIALQEKSLSTFMAAQQQCLKDFLEKQHAGLPQAGSTPFSAGTDRGNPVAAPQESRNTDPPSASLMPSPMPRSSVLLGSRSPDGSQTNQLRSGTAGTITPGIRPVAGRVPVDASQAAMHDRAAATPPRKQAQLTPSPTPQVFDPRQFILSADAGPSNCTPTRKGPTLHGRVTKQAKEMPKGQSPDGRIMGPRRRQRGPNRHRRRVEE